MSLIGIGETAIYNNKLSVTVIDYIRNRSNIVTAYEVRMPLGGPAIADVSRITRSIK